MLMSRGAMSLGAIQSERPRKIIHIDLASEREIDEYAGR
jgi:hypothetical protein